MTETSPKPLTSPLFNPHYWPWWVAYFCLLVAVAVGMIAFRSWALKTYDTTEAADEWQTWKEKATDLATQPNTPVQRRAPTSTEPPGLRLARDYFVACFAGGMTLAAVLLGVFLLMIRGAMATSTLPIRNRDVDV